MVLARYNVVGKAAVAAVATAGLVAPGVIAALLIFGSRDQQPIALGIGIVWLLLLPGLAAATRGLANLARHEGQAVYVEDGRLIYIAPGMIGGFYLEPGEIAHARPTFKRRYRSTPQKMAQGDPLTIVEVGLKSGKRKEVAAYALEGSPEDLAGKITDFAAGRLSGAAASIVR